MKDYAQMIKDTEWLFKDKSREADELKEKLGERNVKIKELRAKDKEHEQARDDIQRELATLVQDNRTDQNQIAILDQEVGQMTRDVADMKREKTILELMAKQQDFWGALEMRVRQKIEELNARLKGLSDEKDPKSINEDRQALEKHKMNFSQQRMDINNAITIYNKAIRTICELSIDGQKILPHHKEARLNVLDRFLHLDHIARYWN